MSVSTELAVQPRPAPTDPGRRIPGLDGLRAFSILLVLAAHGGYSFVPWISSEWELVNYLSRCLRNGSLGVSVFFVISGYLITRLLRREREKTGRISLRQFYYRRVLRIFPAFYSYLGVVGLLTLCGVLHLGFDQWLTAALFSINNAAVWLQYDDAYWFVAHFWTLSLEEQFYLLWPLTLVLGGTKWAPRVAAALIVAMPPTRVVAYFLFPSLRGYLTMLLPTALDPIMMGCLIALAEGSPRFERLVKPLLRGPVAGAALLFLLFASPYFSLRFRGAYSIVFGITLNSLAIGILMLWAVRRPQTSAGRVLDSRPIVHLGVLSYSLYLWQQLFLTPMNTTFTGLFPWNYLAVYCAALASYYLVERPFLALRQRARA